MYHNLHFLHFDDSIITFIKQACLHNTNPKATSDYVGIAKQNTATCELDNTGECVLKYTARVTVIGLQ